MNHEEWTDDIFNCILYFIIFRIYIYNKQQRNKWFWREFTGSLRQGFNYRYFLKNIIQIAGQFSLGQRLTYRPRTLHDVYISQQSWAIFSKIESMKTFEDASTRKWKQLPSDFRKIVWQIKKIEKDDSEDFEYPLKAEAVSFMCRWYGSLSIFW